MSNAPTLADKCEDVAETLELRVDRKRLQIGEKYPKKRKKTYLGATFILLAVLGGIVMVMFPQISTWAVFALLGLGVVGAVTGSGEVGQMYLESGLAIIAKGVASILRAWRG